MEFAAASPLAMDRTARITFAAPRRAKCRAASRPRPMLEPVTMMVWPEKEVVGWGKDVHCLLMKARSMVVASNCMLGFDGWMYRGSDFAES